MASAEIEARLRRDSELSRLRAWEQLQRLRAVLEALCGRRLPEPERRDFEAEGDALAGALYEEFAAMLEDLGRLEAFFGQLKPVIGKVLPEEEAEVLRLSMLEHLPQRPLRLGDVRLRLERAWRTGALPPGAKRRPFVASHAPVPTQALQPSGGEGPQGSQELPSVGLQGEPHHKVRAKAPRSKAKGINPGGEGPALQGTFAWG